MKQVEFTAYETYENEVSKQKDLSYYEDNTEFSNPEVAEEKEITLNSGYKATYLVLKYTKSDVSGIKNWVHSIMVVNVGGRPVVISTADTDTDWPQPVSLETMQSYAECLSE